MAYHRSLQASLILSCLLLGTGHALQNATIAEAFPQLAVAFPQIIASPPESPRLNSSYTLGRQDFGKCCSLAVYESLVQDDQGLRLAIPSYIGNDLEQFRSQQYPCDAVYIGNKSGAPLVTVNYQWSSNRCRGWQRSNSKNLNQWVLPVLGFIIPAVIFCLAIPRRRKIGISDKLFNVPLNAVTSTPRTPFIALVAMILVSIDTILWLMMTFAMAGPVLVSAIYEADIDSRILSYLQEKIRNEKLSTRQRAQLMYAVLVGNIDILAIPPGGTGQDTPWYDISGPQGLLRGLETRNGQMVDADRIASTKTRLRAMLAVQYSFGVTVGAPVVFFCGAFIGGLVGNFTHLGDNDTSHALAFGMWFMTIPHIAVISGLLLAGNNPNTLEGITGRETIDSAPLKWKFLAYDYDSRYHPAWIWDRGRSKRIWAMRCCHDKATAPSGLEDILSMDLNDWIVIAGMASLLIAVPSVLALLTSFYTPKIGLSCRSLTFLLYMICQLWLIALWVWNIESTHLDHNGVPQTPVTRLWHFQVVIACAASIFVGIGGTLMQVIGVYRNCLCNLPATQWRQPTAEFVISINSAEDIHRAATVWKGTGATAVTFLGVVSFIGWWYQKRLRYQFRLMINDVDRDPEEDGRGGRNGAGV